ncbi:exopolysaccharide transport family protein [Oryzifoliimicrobium ureilyticus]|uniref:exopolysaccharide transport family protein n=1 Tax=Oryzifoliimicrobium ureilyticus TaxID=3113724 RepID=UPI0030765486
MSSSAANQDVDIDLGVLARAIWRRRFRIVILTATVACAAFVAAKMVTPQYKSETRILIEQRAPAFASTQTEGAISNPLLDELNIASQVQLLQSADLIKSVIASQKLYERPEFDKAANGSAFSNLLIALHLKKNPLEVPPEERLIDVFNEKLQVYQVPGSRVIGITFSSRDPQLAATIPNAMAKAYLALQSGAKLDSNSEATRWLEPEIEKLRQKVEEAEQKVASYRSEHGLLPTNSGTTFPAQQLNDISAELTRVRGERANAEARANAVRTAISSGEASDTLPDIIGSPTIQRLKATESALQSQISDLQTVLLQNHPRLRGLRAQLTDIRSQIRSETQNVLASIENEKTVADMRLRQLEQQVASLKSTSAAAGEAEVGLASLEREATAQRSLLETYLSRYREATSRVDKNSAPADARIVSAAVQPVDPYFPKTGVIVVVAAVATFVLTIIGLILTELFSGRALRPVGAPTITVIEEESLPAIAKIEPESKKARYFGLRKRKPLRDPIERRPLVKTDDEVVLSTEQNETAKPDEVRVVEPAADRISAEVATPIIAEPLPKSLDADDNEFSVISVADYLIRVRAALVVSISPTGDDGSAAAVSLARALADAGKRVVLLDLTTSGCPTGLMMAEPNAAGVTDLLAGAVAFGDTIHIDRLSEVHIVPQGKGDLHLAMRGADRLSILIDALVSAYETVVVECGAADVASVARLTGSKDIEIVLSMPHMVEQTFVDTMVAFEAAGYQRILLMSGGDDGRGHLAIRDAA